MTAPFTNFPIPTVLLDTAPVIATGGTTARTLASHFSDVVNVADFGAVGDGVSDDAPAINAASAYAVANGITKIIFQSGKTYRAISINIFPRHNLEWDGQGATIISNVNYPTIQGGIIANLVPTYNNRVFIGDLTADLVGPTDQVGPLTSVAGLAVGDWVGMRLGVHPYDSNEPFYGQAAQVKAIVGSTITIDHIVPYYIHIGAYTFTPKLPNNAPVSVAAAVAGFNKSVFKIEPCYNLIFRNINFVGDGVIQAGFEFIWAVNIRLENITSNIGYTGQAGAGLFYIQYSRNVHIKNSYMGCNSASDGVYLEIASSHNVTDENHTTKNIFLRVVNGEQNNDGIHIINPTDYFDSTTITTPSSFIPYSMNTTGSIINPTVYTNVAFSQYHYAQGDDINVEGTFIWRGPLPSSGIMGVYPHRLHCVFDWDDGSGNFAIVDFGRRSTYSVKCPLIPNGSFNFQIPGGVIEADLFLSPGAAALTAIYLPNTNDLHTFLVAGGVYNWFGPYVTPNSTSGMTYWITPQYLSIYTSATAQPANAFVGVKCQIPRILNTNLPAGVGGYYAGGTLGENNTQTGLSEDQMSVQLTGQLTYAGVNPVLVVALPTATAFNCGFRFIVKDATVTTFGTIVAGGGANIVPVYSDGTNWRIG
jgi:hypothetical protein